MKIKHLAIVLAVLASALITAGFFVPPMGVIDGSVLQGAGLITVIIAMLFGWHAVDAGKEVKLANGDLSVQISKNKSKEDE